MINNKLKKFPFSSKACIKEKTDIFLHNMKIIYGDEYDFSEFIYKNSHTKGIFICPIHGERRSTPSSLMQGVKCRACTGNCPIHAKEQFFIKMKELHPSYDFSKFSYKNNNTKSIVICPIHGDIKMSANKLLIGRRCGYCYGNLKEKGKERFFKEVRTIHPNLDFSKFKYNTMKTKSVYICDIHGERSAIAESLINGHGCSVCAGLCPEHSKKQFQKSMNEIHPTLDFSKFKYTGSHKNGKYYCTKHGFKFATPTNLLQGKGCIDCNTIGQKEKNVFNYIKSNIQDCIIFSNKKPPFLNGLEYDIIIILPNNIIIGIEYDGHQHFKPVTFGGISQSKAEYNLIYQRKRDIIKNKLSFEHGIHLFRIHHKDYEKNHYDLLDEIIYDVENLIGYPEFGGSLRYTESYNKSDKYY